MPQGEEFWNPYRMVVVRDAEPKRKSPLSHQAFKGITGSLKCRLTTLTPFLIGKRGFGNEVSFIERDRKPVIPGTSLKGMIRSLAEIVGNGCAVVGKADSTHIACHNADNLCITCRIFGMMEKGHDAKVFMGKVSFGDGIFQSDKPVYLNYQVLMGTPNPKHTSFYINSITGKDDQTVRKFYFHQPDQKDTPLYPPSDLINRAWKVYPLPKNSVFEFDVTFHNLLDEELNLLLYFIALEEDVSISFDDGRTVKGSLRHKLGYGKPLGMGSVHIAITKMALIGDMVQRYSKLKPPEDITEEALKEIIKDKTKTFRADCSLTMTQLRRMLLWNEAESKRFHYPSFNWFRSPGNSNKKLKKI